MIRQMDYKDSYFPNRMEHDTVDMEDQISKKLPLQVFELSANVQTDHSIELLRQYVMCNPDTSFTTFVWTHSDPKPVLDPRQFERKCADWDHFLGDLKLRIVSYEEVNKLRNPKLDVQA